MPTKIAHVSSYTSPNVSCSHPHGALDFFNTGTITIGSPNPCYGTVNEGDRRFALRLSSDAGITAGKHLVITYNSNGCVTSVSIQNGASVLHDVSLKSHHLEVSSSLLELGDDDVDLAARRRWIRRPRLKYDLEITLLGHRLSVTIAPQQREPSPHHEFIGTGADDESAPDSVKNGTPAPSPPAI